jgi:hypothetical protein
MNNPMKKPMNKSILTLAFMIPMLMLACQNNQPAIPTQESTIQESTTQESNLETAQNDPSNLLRNGEFETAEAWTLYPGASLEAGQGKTGRALKAGGAWSGAKQDVQVKPNTKHTIYGLVRSLNGQNCTIAFKGGGSADWNEMPGSSANTWTLVFKVVTTPATVKWAQVQPSGSGCLFDDINLVARVTNPRINEDYTATTGYPDGSTAYSMSIQGFEGFKRDARDAANQIESRCLNLANKLVERANRIRARVQAQPLRVSDGTPASCRAMGENSKKLAERALTEIGNKAATCSSRNFSLVVSKTGDITSTSCR